MYKNEKQAWWRNRVGKTVEDSRYSTCFWSSPFPPFFFNIPVHGHAINIYTVEETLAKAQGTLVKAQNALENLPLPLEAIQRLPYFLLFLFLPFSIQFSLEEEAIPGCPLVAHFGSSWQGRRRGRCKELCPEWPQGDGYRVKKGCVYYQRNLLADHEVTYCFCPLSSTPRMANTSSCTRPRVASLPVCPSLLKRFGKRRKSTCTTCLPTMSWCSFGTRCIRFLKLTNIISRWCRSNWPQAWVWKRQTLLYGYAASERKLLILFPDRSWSSLHHWRMFRSVPLSNRRAQG